MIVLLSCWGAPCAMASLVNDNAISLVQELEDPVGVGNLQARDKAAQNSQEHRLTRIRQAGAAAHASQLQTEESGQRLDQSLKQAFGDNPPIDVMADDSSAGREGDRVFEAINGISQEGEEEARKQSARMEQSPDSGDPFSIDAMKAKIDHTIRKTMLGKLRNLPMEDLTWDDAIPTSSEIANLTRPQTSSAQNTALVTAEREQLVQREHEVTVKEKKLAFGFEVAKRNATNAERQIEAAASEQVAKAEALEQKAEKDDAKAKKEEVSALETKAADAKKVEELTKENERLRQKLTQTASESKLQAMEQKVKTEKLIDKAKAAVHQQAKDDKEDEKSTLDTFKDSAEDMSNKLKDEQSELRYEKKQNAKLKQHLEDDGTFDKEEIKRVAAKAHLVSETLWQGKVKTLSEELNHLKESSHEKVAEAEAATQQWAILAAKLKARLSEAQDASELAANAELRVQSAHQQVKATRQRLKLSQTDVEAQKMETHMVNKKLVMEQLKNKAAAEQIDGLQKGKNKLKAKQTELQLMAQSAASQLKKTQDKLKSTETKLRGLQNVQSAQNNTHIKFASNQDYLEVMAGVEGGHSVHTLPHRINLKMDEGNPAEEAMEKTVASINTQPGIDRPAVDAVTIINRKPHLVKALKGDLIP